MEIKIESSPSHKPKEVTKEELAEFMAMFKSITNNDFKREIILLTKSLFIKQSEK